MSKKSLFYTSHGRASSITGLEEQPQLFSRRASNARPFVISANDSPYEKSANPEYISSARHANLKSSRGPGHPLLSRALSAVGVTQVQRHTTKRSRRVLAFLLIALVVFLVNYQRTGTRYLGRDISRPLATARKFFSPSLFAEGGLSARNEHETPSAALAANNLSPSSGHTFHPNGLLLVNPNGPHPVHALIDNAEKRWKNLLERQSSTLDEAAQEYKRRYKRNPPAGFDAWWRFAKANNVQLVDEYDQISRDFEPYWAMEPIDLRHRNKVMQDREHTFTLSIKDGRVSRHGEHAELRRAKDMANLLSKFSKHVPGEVNMTFIIDDQPAVMMGWNQKERMLELARQGEFWGPSEFLEPDPYGLSHFAKACPPNSPIRHAEQGNPVSHYGSMGAARSFIHDHPKAVDVCSHPEWRKLHGYTATSQLEVTPLVPLFTWAKMGIHSDILVTPLEQYDDDYLVHDPPFELEPKNKLMWRGSTTGTEFRKDVNWEQSQRARLHFMGAEKEGKREIMWSDQGKLALANTTNRILNKKFMDVSFSGEPAQCDSETCEKMREVIDFKPTMGLEEQNQYRYLMDVDGNGWSGRFHRLLSTNGVVLKSSIFPEWYQDRIIPWVHYVPVKVDYSDLYDIMAFFVGNPETGVGAHDAMAQRIAENGKRYAQEHWRRVDMAAYMFRLVLEYGRLLNQDSEEVDFYSEPRF